MTMTPIATVIHRAGRRVWTPSDQLRALGFEDVDIGAVDGADIALANAKAFALYRAAGRALRRRRQMQAAA
jgi:hypothetical protein